MCGAERPGRCGPEACVLACWNMVIPYLCPELPDAQKQALAYGAKVPLVYANVALRNWRGVSESWRIRRVRTGQLLRQCLSRLPGRSGNLSGAANIRRPRRWSKLVRTPCQPGSPSRVQHRAGQEELLQTPFETLRADAEGPAGPNAWSNGLRSGRRHHRHHGQSVAPRLQLRVQLAVGRAVARRIRSPASWDADASAVSRSPTPMPGAFAYTNSAIDQAWRAVE